VSDYAITSGLILCFCHTFTFSILVKSRFVQKFVLKLVVMAWLRWLFVSFPPQRLMLDSRPEHVGFVVDKLALG